MRIESREEAVICLYQIDLLTNKDKTKFIDEAEIRLELVSSRLEDEYIEQLVLGSIHHLDAIDLLISEKLKNWTLSRLGYMERSILRVGVYELLFMNNQAKSLVINAYIELAKSYCDDGNQKFINAVLDQVK